MPEPARADATSLAATAESVRRAQGPWAAAGFERRLAVLQDAGRRLGRAREALHAALRADGLSVAMAEFYGEWILHAGDPRLLERYARSLVRWVPRSTEAGCPAHPSERAGGGELLLRRPDGVVLLVPPGNSPTINGSSVFSILLPGNGVVLRAPEQDRGLRLLVESVLQPALGEAGLAPELVQVVAGKSRAVLEGLVPSPDVNTVVFFGNSTAAQAVAALAHQHRKKLVLELDGGDHLVVWRDADIPAAVRSASHAWDASTQPCIVPKHLLVHGAVFDQFLAEFLARLPEHSRTVEADPVHGVLVPAGRGEEFDAAFAELREVGEVRCGGYRMDPQGTPAPEGRYLAPTVVTLPAETVLQRPLRCFTHEIFFPLIPVVRCAGSDDEIAEQMLRIIGESPFGLRASVWARDPAVLGRFAQAIGSVGLVIFNDDHARSPDFASPWGGPKRSGGPYGESHFFWEKTSRLQAFSLGTLAGPEIAAICEALGCRTWVTGLAGPAGGGGGA
ncbi:MAG TPA: aldehyde dehydrogenase family protein [Polyangia bacterium]|jgi:succinate-semialdehyde dehydrogenase/glutarate-semialdehyde dehydrogenase|nr:aldehyde dehydrogenase family protein [Polyangia bacterium]